MRRPRRRSRPRRASCTDAAEDRRVHEPAPQERRARLHREHRDAGRAQFSLHVRERTVRSLEAQVVRLVHVGVEDPQPEVRHADLVRIGERQAQVRAHRRRILHHLVQFVADVATRLLDAIEKPTERGVVDGLHGGRADERHGVFRDPREKGGGDHRSPEVYDISVRGAKPP